MGLNKAYVNSSQVASSVPFDETTGKGFATPNATDTQAAIEHLRDHTIFDSRTQATAASTTLTLTNTDLNLQFFTGTATGYIIKMPNATTLTLSAYYQLINTSTQTITVKDGNSGTLFTLSQNSIGFLTLQVNGSAAGTWIWWQTTYNVASGVVTYNVVSSTNFTSNASVDTIITGMTVTPQAGTYGVWYNAQNSGTGSGQQLDSTIYRGGSSVTDSLRSNLSTSGTHIFQSSTMTIAQFDGTQACAIYVNPNGNSFTIGQRSMLLIRLGA